MAAMTAVELNFQNPPAGSPQWLGLAQAVFNEFAARAALETNYCGGGLRWQVYFFEDGWMYKNSISNACFFNLGARLARYTKNDTYATIAESTWDWITGVGLMELQPYSNASRNFSINGNGAGGYIAWDGATVQSNCTGINGIPYTYNAGVWLLGAATMYNYVSSLEIGKIELMSTDKWLGNLGESYPTTTQCNNECFLPESNRCRSQLRDKHVMRY